MNSEAEFKEMASKFITDSIDPDLMGVMEFFDLDDTDVGLAVYEYILSAKVEVTW